MRRRKRRLRYASSAASSSGSSGAARLTRGLLTALIAWRWKFVIGFLAVVSRLRSSFPVPRPEFLPDGRKRSAQAACARADRTAHRGDRRGLSRGSRRRSADMPAPDVIASMVDNIGLPISGINCAYGNSGTIGSADADILITLEEGQEQPTEELVRRLRERLPELFPGRHLRLPAGRHRHADPQLRPARANRRAGGRQRLRRQPRPGGQAAEADFAGDRRGGCAHPAAGRRADHQCGRQPHPSRAGSASREKDIATSLLDQPGRLDPDQSDVLAEPEERRVLSGGDADAAILDGFARRSGAHSRLAGQVAADSRRGGANQPEHRATPWSRIIRCSR